MRSRIPPRVFGLLLLSSSLARAQGPALPPIDARLELSASAEAASQCLTEGDLAGRVDARRGSGPGSLDSGRDATSHVSVTLRRRPHAAGFEAHVTLLGGDGSVQGVRELHTAGDCRSLDEGLVVVVATLLGIVDARAPDEPPDEPEEEEQAQKAEEEEEPRPQNERRRRRGPRTRGAWSAMATLGGGFSSGSLPGISGALQAGLVIEHPYVAFAIDAQALPLKRKLLGAGAEARFSEVAGGLRLCGRLLELGLWRLDVCGGARGGAVWAETQGLAVDEQRVDELIDLTAGMRLRVRQHKRGWGGVLDVGAVIPTRIWVYQLDSVTSDPAEYHRTQPGIWLSMSAIFPGLS